MASSVLLSLIVPAQCFHALATGNTTLSNIQSNKKQWLLPFSACELMKKCANPRKTDCLMAFLSKSNHVHEHASKNM